VTADRHSLTPARRAAAVAPFHVMRILAQARALECAGHDIIHMEVGEPDFGTPAPVLESARDALAAHPMKYTPASGLPELRAAIARFYGERYDVDLDPRRVLVTPGGSGALQLALAAVLDPLQAVLSPEPGYPCNRQIVSMLGGVMLGVPVVAADDYQPDPARFEACWDERVRAVLLASPANPTGAVVSRERLSTLHALVRERGAALIVDEIYQGLTYGVDDHTALGCASEDVFVVNSFSKYFGMTGWRLGWLVAPPGFVPTLERLAQNLYLAAPTPSQYAALAALQPPTLALLEQRRAELRARRDVLLAGLRGLGFDIPYTPAGAFYIYATLPPGYDNGERLAARLLEEAGVAVTPGLDFGGADADRKLRFAYATDVARLREALARIGAFI